jgi:hypothetical protein
VNEVNEVNDVNDANDVKMDVPAPPPEAQRFPTWKQVLVMLGGSLLLAASACFGFVVSLGNNFNQGGDPVLTPLTAILFFVGVVGFLVGLVMLIIRMVRRAGGARKPPAAGDPQ